MGRRDLERVAATSKIVRQRDRKHRVVAQRLQVVSLRETQLR
jgi:hypothetical protein